MKSLPKYLRREIISTPLFDEDTTLRTGISNLYANLLEFDYFVGLAILPRIAPRAIKRIPENPENTNAPRWECVVVTPEIEAVASPSWSEVSSFAPVPARLGLVACGQLALTAHVALVAAQASRDGG